jgi:hypothetical protein
VINKTFVYTSPSIGAIGGITTIIQNKKENNTKAKELFDDASREVNDV